MKTKLITIAFFILLVYGCKKADTTATPTSVIPTPADSLGAWQRINTGIRLGMEDIWFTNAQNGYLCGSNFIAKSVDSGKTWQQTQLSDLYYNLFFYNAQDGFALGEVSIKITRDAGITWITKPSPPVIYNTIGDFYFTSPSTGYLRSSTGLYKTTDTCNTWQLVHAGATLGMYFFDNNNGDIVTGNTKTIDTSFTTINGGTTFQQTGILNMDTTDSYTVLQFTDAATGWIDIGKRVYKTTNGGNAWTTALGVNTSIEDINFINDEVGYVATSSTIYKTINGGASWQTVATVGTNDIIEIHFIDENTGWACLQGGSVLRLKQ